MNVAQSDRRLGRRHLHGLMVVTALCAFAPASRAAPSYLVVPAKSSLTFVATQQGAKFTGKFASFDAKVRYSADDLPGSLLDVTIRVASLDTGSPDRDQAVAGSDWFDFGKFPAATFRTVAIHATAAGPVADADLTIKGVTRRIAFPFKWVASAGGATLDSKLTLNRLEFGIGGGEWADDSVVGVKVEVAAHLTLTPAPQAPAPAPPQATRH